MFPFQLSQFGAGYQFRFHQLALNYQLHLNHGIHIDPQSLIWRSHIDQLTTDQSDQ